MYGIPVNRQVSILIAFAAVYVLWGSTYLAIRVGVETLPPALFAGVRFLIAGAIMCAFARWKGLQWPSSRGDWSRIALTGILMLVGGNGLVTWSEQWVDSGQAALIVATVALWMAGMGAWGPKGDSLNGASIAGLLLGFVGVGVLVGVGIEQAQSPPMAYAGLLLAPVLWAFGSVYARRQPVGCSPWMTSAMQMLIAGVVLSLIGLLAGELPRWNWSTQGMGALAYLVVFGSCLGFGAYIWLVQQVTPTQLSTYAYVNPAVAVLLGWWLLDEVLSPRQIIGTLIIIVGVVLVTYAQTRPKKLIARAQA